MNDERASHDGQLEQEQSAERICAIADALRPGDEVFVGDRTRPLEVQTREVQSGRGFAKQSDYPYQIVWLSGNGTRYRLRYSHRRENYPAIYTWGQLRQRSAGPLTRGNEPSPVPKGGEHPEYVSRLVPAPIKSPDELTDFVLSRNIEVIEDA